MDHLRIIGNLLYTDHKNLTRLPKYLEVTGYLLIENSPKLMCIPPTIKVHGNIWCDPQIITNIPETQLPLYMNFNFGASVMRKIYLNRLRGAKCLI